MRRSLRFRIAASAALLLALSVPAMFARADVTEGASEATNEGKWFNPVTDPDWSNDFWPIVIAGVSTGQDQPPTVYEPTICECPSRLFGEPLPGIGITYWEGKFIYEVTRKPGVLMTMGGQNILGSTYAKQTGGAKGITAGAGSPSGTRSQVHAYNYPVMEVVGDMFDDMCMNDNDGFNLDALTEIDPTWQNDTWALITSPETSLFADAILHLACAVEALVSAFTYPLDPVFWCSGSWGSVYPFSGNTNAHNGNQQGNASLLSKFIARQFRFGMMYMTAGPGAQCSPTMSPIWLKSQFRVDPIFPQAKRGPSIYIGQTEVRWGYFPPANYPQHESSAYLVWNAKQCCMRF
ncbi:MAG: TraU family protein [Sinobacteraceae bacterium]|nr:TraU family protein [Nevskiaceae bacterium]